MPTIREIRVNHYITQVKLAMAAGVSVASVVRAERTGQVMEKRIVGKILAALSDLTGTNYNFSSVQGIQLYPGPRRKHQEEKMSPVAS